MEPDGGRRNRGFSYQRCRAERTGRKSNGAFTSSLPPHPSRVICLCLLLAAACPAPGPAPWQTHKNFPALTILVQGHLTGKAPKPPSGTSKFTELCCSDSPLHFFHRLTAAGSKPRAFYKCMQSCYWHVPPAAPQLVLFHSGEPQEPTVSFKDRREDGLEKVHVCREHLKVGAVTGWMVQLWETLFLTPQPSPTEDRAPRKS